MTDNEILNSLECRSKYLDGGCNSERICGFYSLYHQDCIPYILKNALNLVNRQKAEIERLENLICTQNITIDELNKACENIKIKTVEKFTKGLKNVFVTIDGVFECSEIEDLIDDFVKEFTEDKDEN